MNKLRTGLLVFLFFGLSQALFAQYPNPFVIVKGFEKSDYYPGDTIRFTLKNTSEEKRGYGILAFKDGIDNYFTAYFNLDTTWRRIMIANRKLFTPKPVGLPVHEPDVKMRYIFVKPGGTCVYQFVLRGVRTNEAYPIEIRLETGYNPTKKEREIIFDKKIRIHAKWF